MKKLLLFTLIVLLQANVLNARENPFEATDAYEEEVARLIEIEENYTSELLEKKYIEKIQKIIKEQAIKAKNNNNKTVKRKIEEKMNIAKVQKKSKTVLTETKVKALIKKAQMQSLNTTKKIIKQAIKKDQIIYVKPRSDVSYQKTILPFLKVEFTDNEIKIYSQYKILKKFILPKSKKIVIDYKARVAFLTKRVDLESSNYQNITVGNHYRYGFFRLAIKVKKIPKNYKITYKDKLISIVNK